MVDDRLYAQLNGLRDRGTGEQVIGEITPLSEQSLAAWASTDLKALDRINRDIVEWRKKYPRAILPFTTQEMETRPELEALSSTWRSLRSEYLTELTRFRKRWLAAFGALDRVVPTEAGVKNIVRYMGISGNKDYAVAVIPRCGHTPVDLETKQRVLFENLTLNWIDENVVALGER